MHSIRHWSLRYFLNYFRFSLYLAKNKNVPWLSKEINQILANWIRTTDTGFEWGSGRSTLWFALRSRKIISIEHNKAWFDSVGNMLSNAGIEEKVDRFLLDDPRAYCDSIKKIKNESLDFCLVDGIERDTCALNALKKIKSGGILIIDDIQRYFPDTIGTTAPYARKQDDGYVSAAWRKVAAQIAEWRCVRLSNGIKDTVLFFKP